MDTFDENYHATRKELSAAFFKSKLQTITKIIKEEMLDIIAKRQAKPDGEVDIVDFWTKIQSQIFTAVAVGRGNANVMCTYEHPDGKVEQLTLSETIRYLLEDTVNRIRQVVFLVFSELFTYPITSMCQRYVRNVNSVRQAL
jgi:hypothetical protein